MAAVFSLTIEKASFPTEETLITLIEKSPCTLIYHPHSCFDFQHCRCVRLTLTFSSPLCYNRVIDKTCVGVQRKRSNLYVTSVEEKTIAVVDW